MLFDSQHKLVSTRTHLHSFRLPLKLCKFDVRLPVQDARFVELLHGVLLNCCTFVHIECCRTLEYNNLTCIIFALHFTALCNVIVQSCLLLQSTVFTYDKHRAA